MNVPESIARKGAKTNVIKLRNYCFFIFTQISAEK